MFYLVVMLISFLTSPDTLFEMTPWKLTLPFDNAAPGVPDEIQAPTVLGYYHSDYFFVSEDKQSVVFRAHCGGVPTKGSMYPRCELRQMDGIQKANWSTDDESPHTLTMQAAITHIPQKKPHVVCAQIHDGDDVIQIRLEKSKLFIQRDGANDIILDQNYKLGTFFSTKIKAGNGFIRVWYNNKQAMDWKLSRDHCYFKAGAYTQSNIKKGDAPHAYGEVRIGTLSLKDD